MQRSIRRIVLALGVSALLVATMAVRHVAASGTLRLPALTSPAPGAELYPPVARRRGVQGRVLVEFTISAGGRVDDLPTVLAAEPEGDRLLPQSALRYLGNAQFDVPTNWQAAGGPSRKFRFSFVFFLRPCGQSNACDAPAAYLRADRWFTIVASPIKVNAIYAIYD
jgi:TonB family protein